MPQKWIQIFDILNVREESERDERLKKGFRFYWCKNTQETQYFFLVDFFSFGISLLKFSSTFDVYCLNILNLACSALLGGKKRRENVFKKRHKNSAHGL